MSCKLENLQFCVQINVELVDAGNYGPVRVMAISNRGFFGSLASRK